MARIDNLTNFVTDVASAIKIKTGKDSPIPCKNFDTEILSISGSTPPETETPKWQRPDYWLPYPEFDETRDEIYFLLESYETDYVHFHYRISSGVRGVPFKLEVLSAEVPIILSQDVDLKEADFLIDWNRYFHQTSVEGLKQVWIKVSSPRRTTGTITFSAYTSHMASWGITDPKLPVIEIYANATRSPNLNAPQAYYKTVKSFSLVNEGEVQGNTLNSFANWIALENFYYAGTSETNMSSFFSGCTNLRYFYAPNMTPLNLDGGFKDTQITKIPNMNYKKCKNLNSAFYNCFCLTEIPELSFPEATNIGYMFYGCKNLTYIGGLSFGNPITGVDIVNGCLCLRYFGYMSFNAPSESGISTNQIETLAYLRLPNYEGSSSAGYLPTFNSKSSAMTSGALNVFFDSLLPKNPAYTYATINISQCIGKKQSDITIATRKGYQIIR